MDGPSIKLYHYNNSTLAVTLNDEMYPRFTSQNYKDGENPNALGYSTAIWRISLEFTGQNIDTLVDTLYKKIKSDQ